MRGALTGDVRRLVELRAHSWYSFDAGVLAPAALAQRAADLDYPALGLTDAGNLYGALEFAQAYEGAGVRPPVRR